MRAGAAEYNPMAHGWLSALGTDPGESSLEEALGLV